jgi:tape measure domain-containing protein
MTDRVIRVVMDSSGVESGGRRAGKALGNLEGRSQKLGRGFRFAARAAVGLLAALGVRQILRTADAYQQVQNRLRIVTDSTEELTNANARLFDIAQDTRQEFEATVELFTRASIAADELGASEEELFRLVKVTGQALAIQGGAASEASGALRQLSQSFSSGIVRAEEFNSILEGAFPIAQAAARGLDAAAGSVGKLRNLVVEGKVTSEDFFQAILKGGESLEETFAKSIPTISQANTLLSNSFQRLIGEADQATGVTGAISVAIQEFSGFLDDNAEAIVAWAETTVDAVIIGGRAIFDFLGNLDTRLAGFVADVVGTTGVILENIGFSGTGERLVDQAIGARAEIDADLAIIEARFLEFSDRLANRETFAPGATAGQEFLIPIATNAAEDITEASEAMNEFITGLENAEVELGLTRDKGDEAGEAIRRFREDLTLAAAESEIFGDLIPTDEVDELRRAFREFSEESIANQRLLREEIESSEIKEAFDDQIEALETEIELLGADNEALALNAEVRALAAGATVEQAASIRALTEQLADEKDALAAQILTFQGFFEEVGKSAQRTLSGFLADPLSEGLDELPFKFAQVLQQLAADALASEIFKILQDFGSAGGGAGGFLQFVGGLFGGGFASGGSVMGGRSILVGERGPELFSPPGSGQITPNININQDAQGAPTVNIVNVTDPADIPAGLRTAEGEEEVINIIQRNPDQVRRILG